jgi:hypothetical protein
LQNGEALHRSLYPNTLYALPKYFLLNYKKMNEQNGLTRAERAEILVATLRACAADAPDGWVNLAQVGTALRETALRYAKLYPFLEAFSDLVEFRKIFTQEPPAVLVRLRNKPVI